MCDQHEVDSAYSAAASKLSYLPSFSDDGKESGPRTGNRLSRLSPSSSSSSTLASGNEASRLKAMAE